MTIKMRLTSETPRVAAEILTPLEGHTLEECFPASLLANAVDAPDEAEVGWVLQPDGTLAAPPEPPLSAADLSAYAAAKRFEVETGGIVVNGARVATDRTSQTMVGNAFAYMQASGAASTSFKTPVGFVTLSADQVKALALAVGAHVQACFAAEDAADAGIHAVPPTVTTRAQIDAAFAALSA